MASYLTGLRWSDWQRLLRVHAPAVDRGYHLQAAMVSVGAALTSLLARCEPEVRWSEEREQLWRQPVIILGLPRSGTTFLHQLLTCNPRFAYPTRIDCFNPWTCLTLHRWGVAGLLGRLPGRGRGLDRVQVGWLSPEEDDFALAALTGSGPWFGQTFRRSFAERGQGRYFDFADAEIPVWRHALRLFTRKLVARTGRPLVLKSPLHTARPARLLELFPAARFITIFRDPREQFRSTIDIPAKIANWATVQNAPPGETIVSRTERTAALQQFLLERYFESRAEIPPERLRELTYEELVGDPLSTLQSLHDALGLPGWSETEAGLADSRWWQGYERNKSRPLSRDEQELVVGAYQPLFAAGYYPEVQEELRRSSRGGC